MSRVRRSILALACSSAWMAGCAGPGPRMLSIVPLGTRTLAGGGIERLYDTDGDGSVDYGEQLGPSGMIERLRYYANGDTSPAEEVDLASIPPAECRQVMFLLDSVPYAVVREMWERGRLRLFFPPSRTISPFPVMTDLSFAEFFGVSPCKGIEAEYYDGNKLTSGYSVYAHERNEPWYPCVDYHLDNTTHAIAYFFAFSWTDHELRRIQETFLRRPEKLIIGYSVGTSALGAQEGRNGHEFGLIHVDRASQWLVHQTRGRVRIALMSDHGHNLMHSERVPLPELMERFGYRVTDRLRTPQDVAIPQFGVVTCAAIHTHSPAEVARDAAGIEGVEHAMYCEGDRVVVLSGAARATIERRGDAYAYHAERDDPLHLLPILETLRREGKVDAGGFVADEALFEATKSHGYPDVVHRIWRAFHGLVVNTPEVLLSIKDGWHSGSPLMTRLVYLRAAHGNLGMLSSSGFAMSMSGTLPPVMRMPELREALRGQGFDIRCSGAMSPPASMSSR